MCWFAGNKNNQKNYKKLVLFKYLYISDGAEGVAVLGGVDKVKI